MARNRMKFGARKGQTAVLVALVITTLLGATALAIDVGMMYFNWLAMQRAVDSAVLAGANYLPEDTATAASTAVTYATNNGLTSSEIQCGSPAANCITFAAGDSTQPTQMTQISLTATRTVPYYFGRVLGLSSQVVKVSATAQLPGQTTCVNCASSGPTSQPTGGATNPPVSTCSSVGQCDLLPIGLDINTKYTPGQMVTFQQGRVGAGNWDFLSFGNGGNVLRSNIADGYKGSVSVGDFFDTKTGKSVGPADQGFSDRIAASPSGSTYLAHSENDPRVVVLPMVDWAADPNGKKPIEILAFAHFYLQSDLGGGQFTGYFVSDVVPDSLVSLMANQPIYHGAKGVPTLIK